MELPVLVVMEPAVAVPTELQQAVVMYRAVVALSELHRALAASEAGCQLRMALVLRPGCRLRTVSGERLQIWEVILVLALFRVRALLQALALALVAIQHQANLRLHRADLTYANRKKCWLGSIASRMSSALKSISLANLFSTRTLSFCSCMQWTCSV